MDQSLRVRDEAVIYPDEVIAIGVHRLTRLDSLVEIILQDSVIPKRDDLKRKPNEEEDDGEQYRDDDADDE